MVGGAPAYIEKDPGFFAALRMTKRRGVSLHVILTTGAIATGGMDLGQLRASGAGSGIEIAQRSLFGEMPAWADMPGDMDFAFRKT
jgi:hypothetical protein